MPIGSIIGGVGSLVSGLLGSSAASGAGQTIAKTGQAVGQQLQQTTAQGQQGATQAANSAQGLAYSGATTANQYLNNAFTNVTGATSPYMTVGNTAASNLNAAYQPGGALAGQFTAPTAAQAMNTPGYGFQLQQGQQAIQRQAAAAGQYNSGATAKSLDAYTQGLASTYYQNAFNNSLTGYQTNYGNTLNSLLAGSNLGLQGSQIYSNAALGTGAGLSANTMNAAQYMGNVGLQGAEYSGTLGLQGQEAAGNAFMQGAYGTAAGQMGSASAWMNAINGISGAAGGAANYFGNQGTNYGLNQTVPIAGYPGGYPTIPVQPGSAVGPPSGPGISAGDYMSAYPGATTGPLAQLQAGLYQPNSIGT
jgi:hypothetical protein